MARNIWADLMNQQDLQGGVDALASQGMDALQSGAISPEEAMGNFQSTVNPIMLALNGGQTHPLLGAKKMAPGSVSGAKDKIAKKRAAAMDSTLDTRQKNDAMYSSMPEAQVDPVARGSGLTREQQFAMQMLEGVKNASKTQGQYLLSMDPEQLSDLYARTEALPAFQEQKKGIDNMKQLMAMSAEAQPDVFSGPIAGLLQTEFGRNTGAMQAARGMTPEQQREKILSYAGKIQDDQKDLSKGVFDAIGKQKGGYINESISQDANTQQILKAMSDAKAEDPRKLDKAPRGPNPMQMQLNVFREFQKFAGEDRKALQSAQNAINMLNSGSSIGDEAVQVLLARAAGEVGNLAADEQTRYAGSKAWGARVNQAITKINSGRLTDVNRADLMLLAQTFERYRKDILGKNVDYFSNNVAPSLGLDSDRTKTMLFPDGGYGVPAAKIYPQVKQDQVTGGQGGTVRVMNPAGKVGTIPLSRLKAYEANGYKKVEEKK